MMAMFAGLGSLFAGILALDPLRQVFEMSFLTAAQWFFALLAAAIGLTIASLMWRIPLFQEWESPTKDEVPPLEK